MLQKIEPSGTIMKPSIFKFILIISISFNLFLMYFHFYPPLDSADLEDDFIKISLIKMNISAEDQAEYIKSRNHFVAFDGDVMCVTFYPSYGLGRQEINCFDYDSGNHLGGLNYGLQSQE